MVLRLIAGLDGEGLVVADLAGEKQDGGDDLEVVVAGQGDEEVQQ